MSHTSHVTGQHRTFSSFLPYWTVLLSVELSVLLVSPALTPYLLCNPRGKSASFLIALAERSQGRLSLVYLYHMTTPEPITMAWGCEWSTPVGWPESGDYPVVG